MIKKIGYLLLGIITLGWLGNLYVQNSLIERNNSTSDEFQPTLRYRDYVQLPIVILLGLIAGIGMLFATYLVNLAIGFSWNPYISLIFILFTLLLELYLVRSVHKEMMERILHPSEDINSLTLSIK